MEKQRLLKRIFIILGITLVLIIIIFIYKEYKIHTAKRYVELNTTTVEVYSDIKLSDIIKKINGKLVKDEKIDTTKLGEKEIKFKYINDDNITLTHNISINIVDTTPPIIDKISNYRITNGDATDISKSLFCGDNYDSNPKCYIEGDYDVNTPGTYKVTYKGVDSSKNESSFNMNIIVKEPSTTTNKSTNNSSTTSVSGTKFTDIVKDYKNKNTEIGIDVSHWQGNINFKEVKKAGVEFVYIRVGRGNGIGKEYVLDDKFKQNIEGFNKVGIPVGIYFYSHANSRKDAIKEAKWIMNKIKKYNVSLEIVFDWENWDNFQEYNLSFYKLTDAANTFVKEVEKNGYKGMVYSSKNYLENIWLKLDSRIWLAHYTNETNYQGKYKVWQICNDGIVDGISDNQVDINIRYKK